jgi:hypothetical protein
MVFITEKKLPNNHYLVLCVCQLVKLEGVGNFRWECNCVCAIVKPANQLPDYKRQWVYTNHAERVKNYHYLALCLCRRYLRLEVGVLLCHSGTGLLCVPSINVPLKSPNMAFPIRHADSLCILQYLRFTFQWSLA